MEASDEKFVKLLVTALVTGLVLLIFKGLRSPLSYGIFGLIVLAWLWEVVKLAVSGKFKIK
ncbi:hypothetical protein COX27_01635 [Candidatus Kuenenbacteria bacterium CG23_combo_of_CG06-09_8_20_14_all_36_9]|uniref:Uncharacterized protein n=1 Tax=Candidatus Kuenenbacteria bacterium CG10_big_fil_rev_8_21_14_0_10_36_11 TaxID=1974618 RepID=A0A2M6WAQ0_9BACT|nr:MAG: hypothetical protein COX27_01635 [Candidatus Kuenenbacteria bacterium CG23_combo_of_CG06-09_8_20_14_all_36_9]PIT89841.1 MAG: hypothetical protein COU23_01840 [Candidatus Kuenenbacteria bacterium CG10_big_fil_rev_8_21_14_0_10_36_11]